jgi:tetratricopeptide (TPR) repeat protein
MIRKIVFSPILLFIMLLFLDSCNNAVNDNGIKYKFYVNKGDVFFDKKVALDSAFYYYNLAKESCTDKHGEDRAYTLLQIAIVQQYIGDFYGSEETITVALANYKGTIYKPYLYNMLAVSYHEQKKYDDALQYYNKAFDSFEDPTGKTLAQNNIGLIYQEKNEHEKATQLFKPLLKKQNRKIDTALILNNLGYSQFKLNQPEAYSNLLKSLQITDSLKDFIGSISTNIHLSEFFKDKDKNKSKQYALNAFIAAKKVNNPDEQLISLKWLIASSEGIESKKYAISFINFNDSLNLNRNSAKNQFAKIKYDSKKAIENEQKYKATMQIAVLSAIVVLFVALFLIYFIRKRNRNKLVASVYDTENRIAKKIHDELANDVYHAMAFAETQNLQKIENKEALIDNLEIIYTKARDISQTGNEIYTDERYGNFLLDLINSFNSSDVNIILKNISGIDWNKINPESKIALYRVIQELLVNMKKYSEANLVMLTFEDTIKRLQITYSDNGKGIDPAKFSKKGLQNAENRIQAIKGTFTFDKEVAKGCRVIIQIPK